MLFNSITYFVFLLIVYGLYICLVKKWQNLLLLGASYFFYGWWDIRFLYLLVISSSINYIIGWLIDKGQISKDQIIISLSWTLFSCFFCVVVNWDYWIKKIFRTNAILAETPFLSYGIIILCITIAIFLISFIFFPRILILPETTRKKTLLFISIILNLSILGFFKYYNFFISSFENCMQAIGINNSVLHLNIILPVGISFFTFQTMSYTIDIYRKIMDPCEKYSNFALYISFFPQLVAGPIERASNLLTQIYSQRHMSFDKFTRGIHLIIYGLFKKVVIADSISVVVDSVYRTSGKVTFIDVTLGTVLFAIQIYCDFSGYSDIARGTAKLFGFDLMKNFRNPYFSKNPKEFWDTWHISLSKWLRDYLYIPLGGNKNGKFNTYRNLLITMILGGLWHGASWNFIIWGFFHGSLLVLHRLISNTNILLQFSSFLIYKIFAGISFFILTCYGWLLFRAPSFEVILSFTRALFDWSTGFDAMISFPKSSIYIAFPIFILIEVIEHYSNGSGFYRIMPRPLWTAIYAGLLFAFICGITTGENQFIYFTF